jgi:nucleoside phosphorylase
MKSIELNRNVDVLILTVVRVEFMAVVAYLSNIKKITSKTGTLYRIGKFKEHTIALRKVRDQTNAIMSSEVEEAIQLLQPKVVFLVGIAGGIKKVNLGDVVIVSKTYSYDSGKETDKGFMFRDKGNQTDYRLFEKAVGVSMDKKWTYLEKWSRLVGDIPNEFKVIDGAIASGDKVITTSKTGLYEIIRRHCEDAVAVEMEGLGFSMVLHKFPHISGINIRGISDMLDGKDKIYDIGYREMAAENAATFAFHLIEDIEDVLAEEVVFYDNNKSGKKDITNIINQLDETLKEVKEDIQKQQSKVVPSLSVNIKGNNSNVKQAGRDIIENTYNYSNSISHRLAKNADLSLKQVRQLIAKNYLEKAFERLSEIQINEYKNELITQQRAYQDITEKMRLNTISHQEALLTINTITINLLNTISMIEREL